MHKKWFALILMIMLMLPACVRIPEGVSPVNGFDINRYLGTWYEIARLDHSFERGLVNVYAEYSLRDDGGITVINHGYDSDKKEWKQAEGKAYFVDKPDIGRLKVSFFGPFYGGYNIIALDKIDQMDQKEYSYSLVCGPDKSYLWILSRTKKMDADVLSGLVSRANTLGFETDKLIFVSHESIEERES